MTSGKLDLDYAAVLAHARHLVENQRDRFAGTESARLASHYIRDVLDGHGVPCELIPIRLYVSVPESSRIDVIGDDSLRIASVPFANTASTSLEGVEAEVAFLGPGSEEDFEATDVAGKIALVESSYSPPRQEKIRLASEYGASGIMIMHWGDSESDLMVRGNAKAVWGNPELADSKKLPNLPAVGISRRDGMHLARLAADSSLRCRMTTAARQFWDDSVLMPLVRITGSTAPDEIVVVGGHYDAWSGGATDNAVGNGLMIELARTLHARRAELYRSVWIAFWPGHESTTMSGSTWFVDHFWDELDHGGAVYINIDSLGLKDSNQMFIHSSVELANYAASVSRETLDEDPRLFPLARTGDQSFFGIGIPSIYGRTGYSEDILKRTHNATLGWWNHSHPSQDEMDKVDTHLVRKAGSVIENWVFSYATSPYLPGNYTAVGHEIINRLSELQPLAPKALDLESLLRHAAGFLEQAKRLDANRNLLTASDRNRLLRRVASLLTPVFSTVAGRYGQDPYGLSALKTRLPGLYPIDAPGMDPGDGFVQTTLIRHRNRIMDALLRSTEAISQALGKQGA